MKKILLLLITLITHVSAAAVENQHPSITQRDELIIVIPKDVKRDYAVFMHGRDPLQISDYCGSGSRRDVVEVVLIQQALALGGVDASIRFIVASSHARIIKLVHSGKAVMAGNSIWRDLLDDSDLLYVSDPVIENGRFEAGLYTISENKKALNAKSLADVRRLRAVSSKAWSADWQTLNAMKMNSLINTVKWSSMVKMVAKGRADFLLAPFQPSDDLSFTPEGVHLVPVPELKVGLQGSRHFAVSKRNGQGEGVINALNKGIKILKEKGLLEKAYTDSGFFNNQVKSWDKII
ncbi:ABC transporter substrate-binding protein [Psychromonas aquimarina]|uniref:ABC transporter substrate-binding protein n=1 Tax=Psychromonas aquimarina TaxID=444919 RepID=UPI000402994C|nr:ABC transporter substrate-binding protein [Psychromonas aquimarina]